MTSRPLRATLALLLIAVVTTSIDAGQGPPRLPYTLVENWGPLPNGQPWGEVTAVEIDKRGTIIALRRSDPPFVELDRSGNVQKMWGDGMFVWPHGLRLDADGALWVTDGRAANGRGQQVFKMTREGRVLMTLGTKGVSGEGPDTFNGPCDVAIGANGDIFVADGHVNARVVKFTKDGAFVKAWGKRGDAAGEFNVPHAIAIDSHGRLFVADRGNRRIQIFDQDGNRLGEWKQFGRPSGILITPSDLIYVADIQDQKGIVVGSAKDGAVHGVIEGTLPESVAVDAEGGVYAGETTTGRTLRKLVKR